MRRRSRGRRMMKRSHSKRRGGGKRLRSRHSGLLLSRGGIRM